MKKHKLGICIPYRNRKEHLDKLIPTLTDYLNKKGIVHKFYVGHQIDDKLFNRGSMKNIAAHYALNDGCDYVAWHDVDMYPSNDTCDYSYPNDFPIHIATRLSRYNYSMSYEEYFGGVVLFNKEHIKKTNGYSNEYWDWGQEDDDLFWRTIYEGMSNSNVYKEYNKRDVIKLNGQKSYIEIPSNRQITSKLNDNHTISVLFYVEQQPNIANIWMVGDENKKFVEYPLIRHKLSWSWGLSFNNSRALSMMNFGDDNSAIYKWIKRPENMWTWITMSYNSITSEMKLFINDELVNYINGIKTNEPFYYNKKLRKHRGIGPFYIGHCQQNKIHLKGKIAEVKIFDKFIKENNYSVDDTDNLILHYDFDKSGFDLINNYKCNLINTELINEDIKVLTNILPYRRDGFFECMHHEDEGFVNGKWAKGETTAKNERRFVTKMQEGKIDYKNDGINNILEVLDVVELDETKYHNTMFINVKMK